MPVRITDYISTTDPSDTYATHDAALGKGGFRTVNNTTERDAIPAARRTIGMWVNVLGDKVYELTSGGWSGVQISSTGTGTTTINNIYTGIQSDLQYYYGSTQSGFQPGTGDDFFNNPNYIDDDPFSLNDGNGNLVIQSPGRYNIAFQGSIKGTYAGEFITLEKNGSPVTQTFVQDLAGTDLGSNFSLKYNGSFNTSDTIRLTKSGSGIYNNVSVSLDQVPDFLTFIGSGNNSSGQPVEVKYNGSTLTSQVSSIDFVGSGVSVTSNGNAVEVSITGGGGSQTDTNTNIANAQLTFNANRTHNFNNYDLTFENSNSAHNSSVLFLPSGTKGFGGDANSQFIGDVLAGSASVLTQQFPTQKISLISPSIDVVPSPASNNAPVVKFYDGGDNTNFVGLKSADTLGSSIIFTLPIEDGASGTVLTTDGFGNLSFIPVSVTGLAPQNFANTSLTFGGNRVHNLNGYNLTIQNNVQEDNSSILFLPSGTKGFGIDGENQVIGDILTASASIFISQSPSELVNITAPVLNIRPSLSQTNPSIVRLHDGQNNGTYVELKTVSDLPASVSFTLPTQDGSDGYALVTDGAGNLSFAEVSGGGGSVNVTHEFTHISRDLGLIPMSTDSSSGNAASNTTKLNNYFSSLDSDVRNRSLFIDGEAYGFSQKISIPRKSGFAIYCGGNTDLRGDSEYDAGTLSNAGGPVSRLVRVGNSTDPIIEDNSFGLNVVGTLVLEGYYNADRATKISYLQNASNVRPSVGFLSYGNVSAGLASGKQNIQGLTVIGCDVGLQFGKEFYENGTGTPLTNADNAVISSYNSLYNKVGIKYRSGNSVCNNIQFFYALANNSSIVVGDAGDSASTYAGVRNKIDNMHVEGVLSDAYTKVLTINSATRNTGLINIGAMSLDSGLTNAQLLNMPTNKYIPAHININNVNWEYSGTLTFTRSIIGVGTCLSLSHFYLLDDGMFQMHGNQFGIANLLLNNCKFATGKVPTDIVSAANSSGARNIRWYGCYDHFGTLIPDGVIVV